jgi:uroporphyrinogen decarboxylase
MATLGVRNLPTLVIEGNKEFISHIPPINEIQAKIEEYMEKKGVK